MIEPKVRIELVFKVAEHLDSEPIERESVILQAYGVQPREFDDWGNGPTVMETVSAIDEQHLLDLARHYDIDTPQVDAPAPTAHSAARSAEPLILFASHLASKRAIIGAVEKSLEKYGITLFVAHDSIAPDSHWATEIENALDRAHGGVAFLHDGFKESDWCDQEVGWLMGRHVPVFGYIFDLVAYGPLGKIQAEKAQKWSTDAIANSIVDRVMAKSELASNITASLVNAMSASKHFATTDAIWARLRELRTLDSGQCAQLLAATKANRQINGTQSKVPADKRRRYADLIVEFLRMQPGGNVIATDIDAYEQYLKDVDAARSVPAPPSAVQMPGSSQNP